MNRVIAFAILMVSSVVAHGHHSISAEFDSDKLMTVTGRVSEARYRNPHVRYFLDVDANGDVTRWIAATASQTVNDADSSLLADLVGDWAFDVDKEMPGAPLRLQFERDGENLRAILDHEFIDVVVGNNSFNMVFNRENLPQFPARLWLTGEILTQNVEPISCNARIVERLWLNEDNDLLIAATFYDSTYYDRPFVNRLKWTRSDDQYMQFQTCDPDAFYRALKFDGAFDSYNENQPGFARQ